MNKQTVAVITSTIGRNELIRAIESVKAQTYPCRHYIFVDGAQFADKVKTLTETYSELVITYLPMNTGKNGMVNSSINAIAPFLVEEDIICYLDDDNWYEPNHIESLVSVLESGADFAYSLRNLYTLTDQFICHDDVEALGYWKIDGIYEFNITYNNENYPLILSFENQEEYIDTNMYGLPRELALTISRYWHSGKYNDRVVFNKLKELNLIGKSTAKYTINYRMNLSNFIAPSNELAKELLALPNVREKIVKQLCEFNIARHGNKKPWAE